MGQAIESLLAQTFTDFELVIVDNASTDGTSDICRALADRDPRVRYHKNERNIGGGPNWNRAFELAPPRELFKWAAHDDVHAPTFLEKCIAALDATPEAILAFSQATLVDQGGTPIAPRVQNPHLHSRDVCERFESLFPSDDCMDIFGVMRRSALRNRPVMGQHIDGDGVLLCCLALLGPFVEVPEPLFSNRRHASQAGTRHRANHRAWSVWWDPAVAERPVFPSWRRHWELWRAFLATPVSFKDRLRCGWALARWTRWRRMRLMDDLMFYPRTALRDRNAPAPASAPAPQDQRDQQSPDK